MERLHVFSPSSRRGLCLSKSAGFLPAPAFTGHAVISKYMRPPENCNHIDCAWRNTMSNVRSLQREMAPPIHTHTRAHTHIHTEKVFTHSRM